MTRLKKGDHFVCQWCNLESIADKDHAEMVAECETWLGRELHPDEMRPVCEPCGEYLKKCYENGTGPYGPDATPGTIPEPQ